MGSLGYVGEHKLGHDLTQLKCSGEISSRGNVETFNGKFGDEWLNDKWSIDLADARGKIAEREWDYNYVQSYSAPGYLMPMEFASWWRAGFYLPGEEQWTPMAALLHPRYATVWRANKDCELSIPELLNNESAVARRIFSGIAAHYNRPQRLRRICLMRFRGAILSLGLIALLMAADLALDLSYVFKPAKTDISDVYVAA